MPDIDLLKKIIDDSGMTIVSICNKSGIERANFYNRLNGVGEFTASEIVGLTKALRLTLEERDKIFFAE